jgi:glycosyltransferase involved in cell wall biosynthesis
MTTTDQLPTLRPLHLCSVGRAAFGPGAVVLALTAAQRARGAVPEIWSNESEAEAVEIRSRLAFPAGSLRTFPAVGPARYGFSPAMERAAVADPAAEFSVFHQHGTWTARSRVTIAWRRRFGGPTVLTSHGELYPWARRQSRLKKWLAWQAYGRRNLTAISCLQALSPAEGNAYREFGLQNPIAVIPNGVDETWLTSSGCGGRFRDRFRLPRDRRLFLFLSRVTPIKGLPLLLDAMAARRTRLADWVLVIAGPDEFGHVAELQARIDTLGIRDLVRLVGPVYGDDRRDAFAAAEFFVLPTYSEGAPLAALEALGAGVPVLTTRGAPCDYLVDHDCGWWTDIRTEAIGEALQDAVARSPETLTHMGVRGRALVSQRFTWPIIAAQTLRLYAWLLGQAGQPDFVRLD